MEGYGHLVSNSKECIGQFENDAFTGHGIMKTWDYTAYGKFNDWQLDGFGEIWYPDNSWWTGFWQNGPQGYGIFTHPNGSWSITD